ncbi:MAG: DUF4465 domain-containing protein [Planctomycetes bacterium]|nr:DUF4465 domain-containing protein [Planctomycetota bacterium]
MKTLNVLCVIFVLSATCFASTDLANLDDYALSPDSHFSGNYTMDGDDFSYDTTYINSGGASFVNHSNGDGWPSWKGFSVSNETHTFADVQPGNEFAQQYSVHAGSAHSGDNFGVGYMSGASLPEMILNSEMVVDGLHLANVTYTAYDMTNGSGFSKKFGGESGEDEDWLKVVMEGFDGNGASTGTEEFYLADFRFADNTEDYILDTWEYVDLTGLGAVKSVVFSLESSDVGDWGINTPTYFAVDTVVPEPCTVALLGLGSLLLRRRRG